MLILLSHEIRKARHCDKGVQHTVNAKANALVSSSADNSVCSRVR